MKSDTVLDYAVFRLSPKRSRCELFVSSNGDTEKLASGLVKPFVTHLKVAEEQAAQAVQSIKLEVERPRSNDSWFTKGTLERFVRFVSTPEILEMVNTFDAEMSQLEAARKIYSEGNEDHISGALGGDGAMTAADATKKELLRAMDVRLAAVWQDLTAACARASAAGFNSDTVSELQLFSGCFGANHLNEACTRFISLCQRRPDLISPWKPSVEDQVVRSSWGSDMSIEDPVEEPSGSLIGPQQHSFQNKYQYPQASQGQQHQNLAQNQRYFSQPKTSTSAQSSSSLLGHQHRNQNENKEAEKKEEGAIELSSTNQPAQPARRLSVQDRINLFENKQKEISGGKPVVVGRSAELRRLSSDVSSGAEKSVLRRWSGASDMSIDLGIEKKDINGMDSPLSTASLSSLSQSRSNAFAGSLDDSKDQKGLRDAASSATIEPKDVFGVKGQDELQAYTGGFGAKDEEVELKGKNNRKDQSEHWGQLKSFIGRGELVGLADQSATEEKLKGTLGLEERTPGTRDLGISEEKSSGLQDMVESVARKNRPRLQSQIGSSVGKVTDVQLGLRVEDVEVRDQLLNKMKLKGSQSHTRSLSEQLESGFGMKVEERSAKEIQGDQSVSSMEWRLSTGEVERDGRKDSVLSGKEAMKVDDLPVPKMKVQNSISTGAQQRRKMQGRREEIGSVLGTNNAAFPNKKSSESRESFGSSQTPSMEQTQRMRLSKGSQELNHELKIKANELEKLFAEHKLRVPGDQSNSTRKQATNSQYRKSATTEISPVQVLDKETVIEPIVSDNDISEFNTPQKKTANYQEFGNSLKKNISEFSFSDDSRGKFYEKYVQKRDAKLREEWGTKRAEKEAKLKAMQDSLERSRAEMKASLSASADKKESVTSTRRRSDHFRKFNLHSSMKKEQQPVDSTQSEEDEEPSELSEEKCCGQDRSFNEVSFVDGSSKSSQNRKPLPNRKSSSSTPRSTAVPLPRSSAKLSYSNSGRRRGQSENPLAQSVPNFSDLRKENTKPTSGVSKTGNRTQTRTYSRSKSTSEEMPHAKEEKHRRSESLRKSTANPGELKDLSPDGVILAPLKFDEEQIEEGFYEKSSKNVEPKSFLRKGDASVAKQRASVVSETLTHGEEFESPMELDDSIDVATREKEGFETTEVEDSANANNGKVSLSQDFEKIGLSGSENGDYLGSLTHIDPSLVVEMPSSVPSTYHAQDSAGESPVSWNSQMHQVFTYPHETSDIDASLDSPTGSPASWNSHSLSQAEADGAQMRKKWGNSQKPILVAHSSHNQSRKDVTKGFKRLLKFGRKSRGTDNLVDWISATTSEGDDDTEDGRDPANRSSEDLRKSRMGFSQGHPSDDSFNESELFNEHVQALHSFIPAPPVNFKLRDDRVSGSSIKAPRSFFSLSSFRSKGGDSKLR